MNTFKKIAVVTGAGSGIGKAAALALARAGYGVALAGRRRELLEETAREAAGCAGEAVAMPTDVTNPEAVRALFAQARGRYGRIDVLFNNAGANAPGIAFEELSYERWKEVVDVNLTGMFLCAQEAFRHMKQQSPQGGRIINNGSISAHAPRPDSAPYTASKHGVTGLTKTISLDGRKYNVACCQIDIGNAVTTLASRMAKGVKQANGTVAPEPMMDVSYVGNAVLQMAELPLEVNMQFVTIMATQMPFVGRG
jgi:NAD(P)-dependent dehydrogenase (short-subunit alcohol dehydrogenase family)